MEVHPHPYCCSITLMRLCLYIELRHVRDRKRSSSAWSHCNALPSALPCNSCVLYQRLAFHLPLHWIRSTRNQTGVSSQPLPPCFSLRQSAYVFVFFPLTCTSILRSVLGSRYAIYWHCFFVRPGTSTAIGPILTTVRLLLHPLAWCLPLSLYIYPYCVQSIGCVGIQGMMSSATTLFFVRPERARQRFPTLTTHHAFYRML
jgi:hypothetical protein